MLPRYCGEILLCGVANEWRSWRNAGLANNPGRAAIWSPRARPYLAGKGLETSVFKLGGCGSQILDWWCSRGAEKLQRCGPWIGTATGRRRRATPSSSPVRGAEGDTSPPHARCACTRLQRLNGGPMSGVVGARLRGRGKGSRPQLSEERRPHHRRLVARATSAAACLGRWWGWRGCRTACWQHVCPWFLRASSNPPRRI